jgi:hypothetical protein
MRTDGHEEGNSCTVVSAEQGSIFLRKLSNHAKDYVMCSNPEYDNLKCHHCEFFKYQVKLKNWCSGGWSPIGSTRHCGH